MDERMGLRALAKDAWTSRATKAWLVASAAILAADWALALWKLLPLRSRTDAVALHYSVLKGIDRLGDWRWTFLPAALGTAFLLVNAFLAVLLWRRRRPLSHMVGVHTVALQALFLAGTTVLALLNVGV